MVGGPVALRIGADGDTTGILEDETPLRIVERSGEWVRVQVEGWVRESELRPTEGNVMLGVTAADVRARPEVFAGMVVEWRLQYISMQTADDLRRELTPGEPYLLARGPLPEPGYVYVSISEEQREAVERLEPLAEVVAVVRIRAGRSRFLGNPVTDLISFTVRRR